MQWFSSPWFRRKPVSVLIDEMNDGERLHRRLGPFSLIALGVGATIGSGLYVQTGIVARDVRESGRGRATSVVSTVSYLGFLLGPVYVGLWADAVGLRGAMLAIAALAAALLVLTPALLRVSGLGHRAAR